MLRVNQQAKFLRGASAMLSQEEGYMNEIVRLLKVSLAERVLLGVAKPLLRLPPKIDTELPQVPKGLQGFWGELTTAYNRLYEIIKNDNEREVRKVLPPVRNAWGHLLDKKEQEPYKTWIERLKEIHSILLDVDFGKKTLQLSGMKALRMLEELIQDVKEHITSLSP